jgi:hypothetical protein
MLVSGGREPFWEGTELRTLQNTLRREPSFHHAEWRHVSQEAKDFIKGDGSAPTRLIGRPPGEGARSTAGWR